MDSQQNLMERLIAKAQEDTDYRRRLLADPNSALKEAFDIEVPKEFNVMVHEDDAHTVHLVLPASPELTDVQLQRAAGGSCTLFDYDVGDWS